MSNPAISFEFFPPRNLAASFRLWDCVNTLAPLNPRFVSVTYGAGGTTRDLTREAVTTLHDHNGLNVAAHLTCVNATREETLGIAQEYVDAGVREIVALRGDPPKGEGVFTPTPDGFADSCELISALAEMGQFTLRVGAYPDTHPEADSQQSDIAWLKRKFAAGAHEALTQFFFEPERFLRFRDACARAGIEGPIIPGILPIENWKGAARFARACGTYIPSELEEAFENAERNGEDQDALSTRLCTALCRRLLDEGVNSLHFYTLNRPELTRDVCHALGIESTGNLSNVA